MLHGVDYPTYALGLAPLRFPPPALFGGMQRPGAVQVWRLIQFVFNIQPPDIIAPFIVPLSDDAMRTIKRYCQKAKDLAAARVVMGDWSFAVHENPMNGISVEAREPSVEDMHAWASLFRLFWAQGEQASYKKLRGILAKHAASQVDDVWKARMDHLSRWDQAINRLQEKSLRRLIEERVHSVQGWAPPDRSIDPQPPATTISQYLYGEYLHWDERHREVLDERAESPFEDSWYRFQFVEATGALASMYVGFAEVAARLTGLRLNVRPQAP